MKLLHKDDINFSGIFYCASNGENFPENASNGLTDVCYRPVTFNFKG